MCWSRKSGEQNVPHLEPFGSFTFQFVNPCKSLLRLECDAYSLPLNVVNALLGGGRVLRAGL
jgi:hypothetical protein